MNRYIKFRAWNIESKEMQYDWNAGLTYGDRFSQVLNDDERILMQYTGLKDKNDREIYELCELNNRYIVTYKPPKFVLYEMTSGDIVEFNDQDEYEITTEHKPIPKDTKGGSD